MSLLISSILLLILSFDRGINENLSSAAFPSIIFAIFNAAGFIIVSPIVCNLHCVRWGTQLRTMLWISVYRRVQSQEREESFLQIWLSSPWIRSGAGEGGATSSEERCWKGRLQIQDRGQDQDHNREQDHNRDQDREQDQNRDQDRLWTNPKINLLICTYEEFQSGFQYKTNRSVWMQVFVFIKYHCFLLSIYYYFYIQGRVYPAYNAVFAVFNSVAIFLNKFLQNMRCTLESLAEFSQNYTKLRPYYRKLEEVY